MKGLSVYIPSLLVLLLLSCNFSKEQKQDQLNQEDKQLVFNLYQETLLSLKLAEEAITRSTYQETKALAEAIKAHHAQAKLDLEALAGAKGISLPLDISSAQLMQWRLLVRNTGTDFDKHFFKVSMAVDFAERKTIEKIESVKDDLDVRKTAAEVLQAIMPREAMISQVKRIIEERFRKDSSVRSVSYKR